MKEANYRREFIKNSVLIAVTMTLPGIGSCVGPDVRRKECATTADILGPFYKADAPFRDNITPADAVGTALLVRGGVYSDCDKLLENAVVEIWNADGDGAYDTSVEFRFRGRSQTLSDGAYSFRTIVPGRYLNGGTFRPSHIHFRVTAPGHRELISQIYFKDDPFIADDPWAGSPGASKRILMLDKDENGTDTVTFDIHLTRA